jgi:hypothetical protein
LAQPKDFTFDELLKLLTALGFVMNNKDKTSGSRVQFSNSQHATCVDLHKPHQQGSPIKEVALKKIYNKLVAGHFFEVEPLKKQEENK